MKRLRRRPRNLRRIAEKLAESVEAEKAAVKSEKASVESKLRELGEREEDFESLGSYIEERAIGVRKVEEELAGKRKELEVQEKEIERKREELEERLYRFQNRAKGLEVGRIVPGGGDSSSVAE
ncbi:unnamed protein product [Linum trigynum]|uniref:Uncharacterized protein n=1 Tax=Linum trigynum TaxID=586398 RepID=A0AAV2GXL2_9ROSI